MFILALIQFIWVAFISLLLCGAEEQKAKGPGPLFVQDEDNEKRKQGTEAARTNRGFSCSRLAHSVAQI